MFSAYHDDGIGEQTEEIRPQQFDIDTMSLDELFEGDRLSIQKIFRGSYLDVLTLRILYTPDFTLLGYQEGD